MPQADFCELPDTLHTFHDAATLRRELFETRLAERNADGSEYRVKAELPTADKTLAARC